MTEPRRPVGRPSKYNEQMQAHADRYVFDFNEQGDVIPSNAGLCCWLGISRSTLHEWSNTYAEFSSTLEAIQSKQETMTLNKALVGEFNSTIAKLVLANHGYSDRQDIAHTSPDGSMSPTTISIVGVDADDDDSVH